MVVKEEVNRSVRELVKEEVTKAMGNVIAELILSKGDVLSETASKITKKERQETLEEVVEQPVVARTPVKINTGNPALDSVLQETAASGIRIPRDESVNYEDLVRFDKIGVNDTETSFEAGQPKRPETKIDYLKTMVGVTDSVPPSVTEIPGAVPDVLKSVFKKDYRKLLNKVEEVQKNGGSGMVPGVTMG